MEQTKQHPLCRMKQGWCRDCQVDSGSSLYKEVCLISQASDLLAKVSEQEKENKELTLRYNQCSTLISKLYNQISEQSQRIIALESENKQQGDIIVSIGKVLLKPNEREQFEVRIGKLEEALRGFVNDIDGHPSYAAREHYKPLLEKAKALLSPPRTKE